MKEQKRKPGKGMPRRGIRRKLEGGLDIKQERDGGTEGSTSTPNATILLHPGLSKGVGDRRHSRE